MESTTDHQVAISWAQELLGEINAAKVHIGPGEFLEAWRSADSFSFTRTSEPTYGQAFGPNPHFDPRWGKVAVSHSKFGPVWNGLQIANQFDFYGCKPEVIAGFEEIEIINDDEFITEFLKANAEHSSVYPGNPEIIFWAGIENKSIAALVKWSSGTYVLASVATKESERGKGLATQLTKRIISKAATLGIQELYLGVAHKNVGAIKAYKNAGFFELAEFTNYFLDLSLQSKH